MMTLTLRDQIKKAQADQDKAAQEANPYSTPISPGALQTSNPDVQKMAGTPAQKDKALSDTATLTSSVQKAQEQKSTIEQAQAQAAPVQDLEEAKTTQQYQADAATEKAKAWAESMSSFGSLSGRVESLIQEQIKGPGDGELTVAPEFEVDYEIVDSMALPGQETAVREAVAAFQTAATQEEAFAALASASGSFADPSAAMMEFMNMAYKNDPDAQKQMVANAIASNIMDPDQLTIQQLVDNGMLGLDESGAISELGMTEQELVEVLGEDWASLTPAGIDERLQKFQEEDLNKRDEIMTKLSDPMLDSATRAGLVDELKRLGQVGELQAEQLVEESRKVAEDAGKIVFNGEVRDIEDLLDDESIKDEVQAYLLGDEGSEEFRENNPEFADWIDREFGAVKDDADALQNRMDEFQKIQEDNEKFRSENISEEAGGAALDEDVMTALGFGEGLQAAGFDPSSSAIYQELADITDPQTTKSVVEALNGLPGEMLEELKAEFLTSPDGAEDLINVLSNPSQREALLRASSLTEKLDTAGSVDDMVHAVTGGKLNSRGIQDSMNKLRLNSLLGDTESQKKYDLLKSMFDTDPADGQIDSDPAKVSAAIKNMVGDTSLEGLMKSASNLSSAFTAGENTDYTGNDPETQRELLGYMTNDGKITPSELNGLRSKMVVDEEGTENLISLLSRMRNDPNLASGLGISTEELSKQITEAANLKTERIMTGHGQSRSLDRWELNPDAAATDMSNTATFDESLMMQQDLQKAIDSAQTPEERAALQAQMDRIEKATSRVYLNDWPSEMNASNVYSGKNFDVEVLDELLKHAPEDLKTHGLLKNPNGTYTIRHIKAGGYNPHAQGLLQYLLAADRKLQRQGSSLVSQVSSKKGTQATTPAYQGGGIL